MKQRGMSSLSLVLLLLVIGSLLLTGFNQQIDTLSRIVSSESQSIRQQAAVEVALEWGRRQPWQLQPDVQCKSREALRVCLRIRAENRALLIAGNRDFQLWRGATVTDEKIVFLNHGWSDFCPLKEGALCQLP